MSTKEYAYAATPLYARVLRLRRLQISGVASFLLVEGTIATAILLALAELVSGWAVPVLPFLVATVVKINDMVGGPFRATAGDSAVGNSRVAFGRAAGGDRWPLEISPESPVNPAYSGSTTNGSQAGGRWGARDWSTSGGEAVGRRRRMESGPNQPRQRGAVAGGGALGGAVAGGGGSGGAVAGGGALGGGAVAGGGGSGGAVAGGGGSGGAMVGGRPSGGAGTEGAVSRDGLTGGAVTAGQDPGILPTGVPGAQAPRRAQIIGAAVRRSMAQAQFGTTSTGNGTGGNGFNNAGTAGRGASSGRHSRRDETTGRHAGLNERGFGRSA